MLLDRIVVRQTICLRLLSEGDRAQEVAFGRFLANEKVTPERLIEGWSEQTESAAAGRHVLAIQDTSEINFKTKPGRRRGLGEIGKGSGRGVLVHAMVAVDADNGSCLGLVGGSVRTRAKGRVKTPHAKRALKDKESRRWIETGAQAKTVLAQAARVTVVHDREGDIYASWASLPGDNFHVLARAMHDRAVAGGGTLSSMMAKLDFVSTRTIELLATPKREARQAVLSLRFSSAEVVRPDGPDARGLPKTVSLRVVEVVELNPPAGVEPVRWRLLTTHAAADVAAAWQIRRLVPAALDDRAIVPPDEDPWPAARGQPARQRRGLDQARRHRRQGGGGDLAARAGARRQEPGARRHRLQRARDRAARRPCRRPVPRQNGAAEEPAPAAQPGLGHLDHRPLGRLERLSILEAARADHAAAWPGVFSCHRQRLEPPRCVHTVAQAGRGGALAAPGARRLLFDDDRHITVACGGAG